jgi:hypothetical protein
MRRWLNNPKVVLPAALVVLIVLLMRTGTFDGINIQSYFKKKQVFIAPSSEVEQVLEIEASRLAQAFTKERWLPNNWQQYANLKRELFVADYQFEDDVLSATELAVKVNEATGEVEIMEGQLTSYIAENTGLDRSGFFVRFGVIRKREGDDLKTKDGEALTLGKIAMPDQGQLNGNGNYRTVEAVIASLALEATSPVEKEEETSLDELDPAPELYREGDVVTPEKLDRKPVRLEYASAVILGGVSSNDIYREGDLISRVPAVGLAGVYANSVELVDREGRIFELELRR